METKTKKRGWIKDAAIIFLAVLLVLTFFSNTILNRSLPQVTTELIRDGAITTKVRGTGTVTARENFDVTVEQTRKVLSVLVRTGDEVRAGDVLFTLEPGDSSELAGAQATLKELEKSYQRALITASSTDYARENREIEKAREALEDAQAALERLKTLWAEDGENTRKLAEAQAELKVLTEALAAAQPPLEEAEAAVDTRLAELKAALSGKESAMAQKKAAYEALTADAEGKQQTLREAQQALQAALEERNSYSPGSGDTSGITAAQNAVSAAQAELTQAQNEKKTVEVLHGTSYTTLVGKANGMMDTEYAARKLHVENTAETQYRTEQGLAPADALTPEQTTELAARQTAAVKAALGTPEEFRSANLQIYLPAAAEQNKDDAALYDAYNAYQQAAQTIQNAEEALRRARNDLDSAMYSYNNANGENTLYWQAQSKVNAAQKDADTAQAAADTAEKLRAAAEKEKNAAETDHAQTRAAIAAFRSGTSAGDSLADGDQQLLERWQEAQAEVQSLTEKHSAAKAQAESLQSERDTGLQDGENQVEARQESLEDLVFNLQQQKENDSRDQKLQALELQEMQENIAAQKALIQQLTAADTGSEVKAKVSGKVKSLNVSAGYKAEAGAVLATIEVPDLGYTLSFSVTNEQARRLRVGDTCSVSNYYWGSKIEAELLSIVTDPQNPQSSKRLTFGLTGDVSAGSSLTLSVGEKNANYDMVVPNGAVRSDSKGSFILIVTAKNSPLGNRYYASRVNVEILSSDDQYSAISGPLEGYESVIVQTSGNAPIAAGDQVRLADSNNGTV